MDYSVFLKPELMIVVAVLIFIGVVLKNTKKIADELIPVMLMLFGIIIVGFMIGWSIESIIQGILAAACAVYGNQIVKQSVKLKKVVDEEVKNAIDQINNK